MTTRFKQRYFLGWKYTCLSSSPIPPRLLASNKIQIIWKGKPLMSSEILSPSVMVSDFLLELSENHQWRQTFRRLRSLFLISSVFYMHIHNVYLLFTCFQCFKSCLVYLSTVFDKSMTYNCDWKTIANWN